MKPRITYAVCELLPSPIGDTFRILVMRDRQKDAEIVLKALHDTDYDFSVYKIMEYPIGETL